MITLTNMQAGVASAVIAAIILATPPLWVNTLASNKVDDHNHDEASHAVQHQSLKEAQSLIREKQREFAVEIDNIKGNQDEIKTWLRDIDGKLDRLIEGR